MKEIYIELMEQSLSAYTDEHIQQYFNDVKRDGLQEHGFPRLTANIGILLARGKRMTLLPIFCEMMDFCCKTIPTKKAANDFSVREIICCLLEVEKSNIVSKEVTDNWRMHLREINPVTCYNMFATKPTDTVRNWAIFTSLSEYFRQQAGLCDSSDFIDLQLMVQLQWFDGDGLYCDNASCYADQPILYDVLSRGLLALLLDQGYRGKYYEAVDEILKKAGLLTMKMQSSNGEIAFGGRSNQFVHNEAWLMAVYEYEAKRYAKEGNALLAASFKSACAKALKITENWLSKRPIRHVKNHFPTETKYGCEPYAYYDKYMITVASNLYAAYLICDDSIETAIVPNDKTCTAVTSDRFHKVFLKSDGYALEFDINADTHYDANGLGRIHKTGAPSAISLSVPCPSNPHYQINIDNPIAFSACSAIRIEDTWRFGAEKNTKYELLECGNDEIAASATFLCKFANGQAIKEKYDVLQDGVSVTLTGDGDVAFTLPAFYFDGEKMTDIIVEEHSVSVYYEEWVCRYTTDGEILDLNKLAANRNGHYRIYVATGQKDLNVKIEITKL